MVQEITNNNVENQQLKLSSDDFTNIDSNSDNRLSLVELMQGKDNERFQNSDNKQDAISYLANHLQENAPNASLPNWNTSEFARERIGDEEFRLIDADGNDILSRKELNNVDNISKLSPIQKHAGKILGQELDLAESDPLSENNDGLKNWNLEKNEPCSEQMEKAQERLEKNAEEIAKAITSRPERGAWQNMMSSYNRMQQMWEDASSIQGNPMRTMEDALNKALEGSGNSVRIMDPMGEYTPKYQWSRMVDAVMTVNPDMKQSDSLGTVKHKGVYGLTKQ